MRQPTIFIGVSDHAVRAGLVVVDRNTSVLSTRKIILKDDRLPVIPRHFEEKELAIDDTIAFVKRVRFSV